MKPRYLLDTGILIYIRQRRLTVLRRFDEARPGTVAISVVTYGELTTGIAKSADPERRGAILAELLALVPVLPLPVDAGARYGTIRASLEAAGTIIGNNDLWIAAHALAEDLIVVTNNQREFARVDGLRVENWTR